MEGQSTYDLITDNTVDSVGLDYADMVGIGAMLPQNMITFSSLTTAMFHGGIMEAMFSSTIPQLVDRVGRREHRTL